MEAGASMKQRAVEKHYSVAETAFCSVFLRNGFVTIWTSSLGR
jgi:hypothetical protein